MGITCFMIDPRRSFGNCIIPGYVLAESNDEGAMVEIHTMAHRYLSSGSESFSRPVLTAPDELARVLMPE